MNNQKNKKWFLMALVFIFALIAIVACNSRLFHSPKKPIQRPIMLKYKKFETKNPSLDFTFEYPEMGWQPVETVGRTEKYDQVYLRGPVDKTKNFITIIDVTVRPLEAGKGIDDLLATFLNYDSNFGKFMVLQKGKKDIAGEKASFALSSFEQVPLPRIEMPPVPFKKQMIFLIKDGRSYEFTLITIAEQYDIYEPILERVLATFKFTK